MPRGRPSGSKAATTPKGRQASSQPSLRSSSPIVVSERKINKPRATRASLLRAIEIPDSDSLDDIVVSGDAQGMAPSKESNSFKLKEVAVVKNNFKKPAPRQKQAVVSSSASSVDGDMTSDYETPGTSVAVTPAEFSVTKSTSAHSTGKRVSATARALELRAPAQGLAARSTSKKRRAQEMAADDFPDLDADAQLARRLQAEEYEEDAALDAGSSKRKKTAKETPWRSSHREIDSASGSESILLDSDSEEEIPLASVRRGGRLSLPSRAARDSARKSIKKKLSRQVPDSEDDDPLDLMEDYDLDGELSDQFEMESEAEVGSDSSLDSKNIIPVDGDTTAAPTLRRRLPLHARTPLRPRRARRPYDGLSRTIRERRKLEKRHPQIKTMWDDLRDIASIKPIAAEQPTGLSRTLKSFQLEGLNWMTRQEQTQWRGGLLGDEMGMGKTIQAVSLIMSDYPAKNPTLVVVPPVALMQWQEEIRIYTDGKLKVLVYHNTNSKVKNLRVKDLKGYDVIMISYSGLESMYRKETKGWARDGGIVKEDSIIHAIKFHRLILDEAHSIKTRTTGVAKACFALQGDFKWCLSGTPVQNRIGEFFSLLRFLEIRPFASYFCKDCDCAELHWSQDEAKKCTHCHHTGFNHVSVFNQELLNPITQGEDPRLRKQALEKLRLITDRIMLRRLKRDYTASMELPPKEVVIHNEFFGEIERDFSSSIMTNTNRQFDTYVSRGVMLNNYANIFGLIMQMRQVANHPDLILKRHSEGGQNVLVCCICDEPAEEAIRSKCRHEFCRQCVKNYVRSMEGVDGADPDCPRCHIPLAIDFDQPDIEQDEENVKKSSIINRIKMEDWTSSTKIEMLVYDLYKLRSKKQTHKSIVFSQFTSMLQLIEWRLHRAGFNTVMLDGSMSPVQRQKSIEHFMTNVDCEVFLVSLKAGGVALNLTEASRVFIVDPWWNPAAEWQSADRCHRIGQKRPCVITRLCIEDSVESRMVMLQEKKANMINGTINNDQVAMDKLTPEDMQFLFRGS